MERDTSPIFYSPSVARKAAAAASDWSYIESWLASRLPGKDLPPFERNQGTLKALLDLVALSEAGNDIRILIDKAEHSALGELSEFEQYQHARKNSVNKTIPSHDPSDLNQTHNDDVLSPTFKDDIIDAVQGNLSKEGVAALYSLASVSVRSGIPCAGPDGIVSSLVNMKQNAHAADQAAERVKLLRRSIKGEIGQFEAFSLDQKDSSPDELSKRSIDLQKSIQSLLVRDSDQHDFSFKDVETQQDHPWIDNIATEEQDYLDIVSRRRELGEQMMEFQGLPSDPDMARSELDTLRRQLRELIAHRDAMFEGLVELESPVKRRK